MNSGKDLPTWTIDSSEYVVNNRFLKLRADSCTTPQGGKVDTYYVLELKDWVNCIAIDQDDNVIMLRHYRHGVQKYLMEFIGGGMEKANHLKRRLGAELKKKRAIPEAPSTMWAPAIRTRRTTV